MEPSPSPRARKTARGVTLAGSRRSARRRVPQSYPDGGARGDNRSCCTQRYSGILPDNVGIAPGPPNVRYAFSIGGTVEVRRRRGLVLYEN